MPIMIRSDGSRYAEHTGPILQNLQRRQKNKNSKKNRIDGKNQN